MQIGIDSLILRGPYAGTHRYLEQLLTALASSEASNTYTVFANQEVMQSELFPRQVNFTYRSVKTFRWVPAAIQQQFYGGWQSQGKLDLLHTPGFAPPLGFKGKTVITVFDLTYKFHPKTQKWSGRLWRNLLSLQGLRKASHLICISESTKNQVIRLTGIPEDRMSVIYPYPLGNFKRVEQPRIALSNYHLPESFILYVGTLERRKNIPFLLRAFAKARRQVPLPHSLVIAGQRGWLYEEIYRVVDELGIRPHVHFLGYVPDRDLPALYSAADLFVYLSLYEGFGLPVLEAMACGTPVLVSSTSSLPEVVGKAGVQVPTNNLEAAASSICQILTDERLRADLSARALVQADRFSLGRFTNQTLAAYQICASG